MRSSAIIFFAAAALSAPFVSAQTAQSSGATTQPSTTRRDIVSYVEELAGNTAAQLRVVQDENAELETRIIELERKLSSLQETNKQLQNEIAAVRRQAATDAENHETQMRSLESQMKNISSKIDKLAATIAATPPPSASVPTPVSAAVEYDIYEVQKNATLSAIAKAYSDAYGKTVTVQEIKKANNLKSDTLQIGQKLKIPRK
jgi:LysM repeat protein